MQLTLQLAGYPRPIAWTLSELDRTHGDRDQRDMLLTAFEDVTRYLTLVSIARYAEYFAHDGSSESVEGVLQGLRRPSFGHYVQALRALDQFLVERSDPFALDLSRDELRPAAGKICATVTGAKPNKKVNFVSMLSHVVEIRNRDKGHGFTDHDHARATTDLLAPALVEFLEHVPVLLTYPLVWIEHIEFVDKDHSKITLLELMGTQRAARRTRDVQGPGNLQKNFMYMWNGEAAPVQLTPFFHFERTGHDEVVYVLSTLGAEPTYRAPGISSSRTPDPLLPQLSKRAPFLMTPDASVTASRAPDAERRYRDLVDMALADGVVTTGEAQRLAEHRVELGLSETEAIEIHKVLGWNGIAATRTVAEATGASPARDAATDVVRVDFDVAAWPDAGRRLASMVRDALASRLGFEPELVLLDDDLDVAQGELWIQLQPSRGVALWFPQTRKQLRDGRVLVAIGFYSQNQRRDPGYRAARAQIEAASAIVLPKGWSELDDAGTFIGTPLGLETSRAFSIASVCDVASVAEIVGVVASFATAARAALEKTGDDEPLVETIAAPLVGSDRVVTHGVPAAFDLPELGEDARIHGSIWIARILWALEWATRHDASPKTASDIARILSDNGVRVPGTNTARAFRVPRDDPRRTGLCEEMPGQRYVISASGRRALFELITED